MTHPPLHLRVDPSSGSKTRFKRLQALFDKAPDAILFANNRGECLDANPALCRLAGSTRDGLRARHLFDLIPPDDRPRVSSQWKTFVGSGVLLTETEVITPDGVRTAVEVRGVARVLPNVHVAVMRDIAGRDRRQREIEEALRESDRKVRAVAARARARREEDRTRLARELHDQLGQSLAGLKLDVFWLRDHLGPTASEPIVAKIRSMLFLLDDTIRRVRVISSNPPPVLDRLGLVPALEWAAEEFSHRSGIRASVVTAVDDTPLDRGRGAAVFRIVQEVLTNAATHSRAANVEIAIGMSGESHVTIEVKDDGVGMPPAALTSGESIGLIGMQERASCLGGTVTVRPAAGRGTIVTVSVPVAERRQKPRDDWA